jgi:DNA-binding MarR family transcriptional regulator
MKTNRINKKSVQSYQELFKDNQLTKRQLEVLTGLNLYLGQATNRMIAKHLGWDINRVTGRITELRDKGLVVHAGDYYDQETERTVNLWKCS